MKTTATSFACRWCGEMIYTDPEVKGPKGRPMPLNVSDKNAHNCPDKPRAPIHCRDCGELIYFDPTKKSPSGKSIPLDPNTHEGHQCAAKQQT